MDIYIAKDGQPIGPYRSNEIQARLEDSTFDGTELAWRKGMDSWVSVKELDIARDKGNLEWTSLNLPVPAKPAPLDEETLEPVKKLITIVNLQIFSGWGMFLFSVLLAILVVIDIGSPWHVSHFEYWGHVADYLYFEHGLLRFGTTIAFWLHLGLFILTGLIRSRRVWKSSRS